MLSYAPTEEEVVAARNARLVDLATPEQRAQADASAAWDKQNARCRRIVALHEGSDLDRAIAGFALNSWSDERTKRRRERRRALFKKIDAAQHGALLLAQLVIDFLEVMLAVAQPQRDEFLRPAPAPALAGRVISDLNLTPRILAQRPITRRV